MSDESAPPDAAPHSAATHPLFVVVAMLIIPAAGGWILAHGPDAWRRPFLTPIVLGVLVGLVLRLLVSRSTVRQSLWVSLGVASLAIAGTLWMHAEIFRRVESAAIAFANEHPDEVQALNMTEALLGDDAASDLQLRSMRLAIRPSRKDYLEHRAASFWGERPWPAAIGLLGIEALLSAVAAMVVIRMTGASAPPVESASS